MSTSVSLGVKEVRVKIRGLPPGLMFGGKGLMEQQSGGKDTKHMSPEEEAPYRAHWMDGKKHEVPWSKKAKNLQLCIPSVMIYRSFCQAAIDFKDPRNKKKSISYLVGATVAFKEEVIPLNTTEFEVKVDWVRIPPRTGAMVKIGRPLVREWEAEFILLVDDEDYNLMILKDILVHAGKNVGAGPDRPGLKGPHGRWVVVEFEIVE